MLPFPDQTWFAPKVTVAQQEQLLPRLNFWIRIYWILNIWCRRLAGYRLILGIPHDLNISNLDYLMQAPRKALGGGGSSGAASRAIASSAGGGGVAGAYVHIINHWSFDPGISSSTHLIMQHQALLLGNILEEMATTLNQLLNGRSPWLPSS